MVRFPAWFMIKSYNSFITNICMKKKMYKRKTHKKDMRTIVYSSGIIPFEITERD